MSVSHTYSFLLELIKSFPCSFNPFCFHLIQPFWFPFILLLPDILRYIRYILSLSHCNKTEWEENVRLQNFYMTWMVRSWHDQCFCFTQVFLSVWSSVFARYIIPLLPLCLSSYDCSLRLAFRAWGVGVIVWKTLEEGHRNEMLFTVRRCLSVTYNTAGQQFRVWDTESNTCALYCRQALIF